jgi:hypothetical protein
MYNACGVYNIHGGHTMPVGYPIYRLTYHAWGYAIYITDVPCLRGLQYTGWICHACEVYICTVDVPGLWGNTIYKMDIAWVYKFHGGYTMPVGFTLYCSTIGIQYTGWICDVFSGGIQYI